MKPGPNCLGLGLGVGLFQPPRIESPSALLGSLSFVNDLATTYSRGSSAFHPITGATVGTGVRRRRTWRAGGRDFSLDLNEQNRTNVCLQSNALATSPWAVANVPILTQTETDAYGNVNTAWLMGDSVDVAGAPHVAYQQIAKAASALPYTAQCEFKVNTPNTWFKLQMDVVAAISGVRVVISADGVITGQEAFGGGGWTLTRAYVVPLGGGWFRAVISGVTNLDTNIRIRPTIQNSAGITADTYQGDGTRRVVVARCQVENASHGSSYINTTATTAARAVEGGEWTLAHTLGQQSTAVGLLLPFMWGDTDANASTFYVLTRSGTATHGLYSVSNGNARAPQAFSSDAAAQRTATFSAPAAIFTDGLPAVQAVRRTPGTVSLHHNGEQTATAAIVSAPWADATTAGIGSTPSATSPAHGWVGLWTIPRALSKPEMRAVADVLLSGAWA